LDQLNEISEKLSIPPNEIIEKISALMVERTELKSLVSKNKKEKVIDIHHESINVYYYQGTYQGLIIFVYIFPEETDKNTIKKKTRYS